MRRAPGNKRRPREVSPCGPFRRSDREDPYGCHRFRAGACAVSVGRTMLRSLAVIAATVLVAVGCGPAREPSQGAAPGQPAAAEEGTVRVQDKGRPEITSQGISRDV